VSETPRELWDGVRAPVTLLGGYLGSGKTTLLNALLAAADRRYAVLVNDIGAVNVDAALVARQDGETLELTDGCVCCSLVDGFAQAFEQLRARPEPPEQVVVELSGVADPARVVPWTGTAGFRLDGVVVIFDAEQGLERERDRWSGDTVQRQVAAADLLLLSKCDLVDAGELARVHQRLSELAPQTPVIESAQGKLPARWIGSLNAQPRSLAEEPISAAAPDDHSVFQVDVTQPTDPATLEAWLAALPDSAIRIKGIVPGPRGLLLVEGVGRRRRVVAAPHVAPGARAIGSIVVVGTPELRRSCIPRPQ
jgi:G3E family GTPase